MPSGRSTSEPCHGRQGPDLEEALLSAAWAVLRDHGYAGSTLAAVAGHAGTSRPVTKKRQHQIGIPF
ncbi:TetR/AcrR family transcriptional regulator [Streptomyces sp. NBC_01497]